MEIEIRKCSFDTFIRQHAKSGEILALSGHNMTFSEIHKIWSTLQLWNTNSLPDNKQLLKSSNLTNRNVFDIQKAYLE